MTNLKTNDFVGISFWLISMALGTTTAFLIMERDKVLPKWKLSLNIATLVTGIATVHYLYMRNVWVNTGKSPIVYRYIDWFLTVPLQIIEFYLILSISNKVPTSLFYKLLISSILMLVFGFLGETRQIDRMTGFIFGTIFWLYILYLLFYGEAANYYDQTEDNTVKFAFDALKWIITIGWSIYPIGYVLGDYNMNLVYNIGDLVNKILFALLIWSAGNPDIIERFLQT